MPSQHLRGLRRSWPKVIRLIGLVPALGSFRELIGGKRQDSELETIERKVFQSAEYLSSR
jgi:hypothetical protein